MLGDGRLDALDSHLSKFKQSNQANQQSLQVLVKEFSQLLEDYRILKSAHEANGAKNGDTRSSNIARNPYILVLVDGNGYIFNNELVKDKEEGGMRAARMLNEAVKDYIRTSLPASKHHRVIVRMYADITGLSKLLAKSKLVGLEKRSLAAFTAGFTRAISLFDFMDALDEEGTRFKIREMFKLGAEDSACSHIFFAGCHDNSYLPGLVPFSGLRNKVTLVQGAGFSSEFHQFSLNITQFPTVFRWSDLSTITPIAKSASMNTPAKSNKWRDRENERESGHGPLGMRNENRWNNNTNINSNTYGADATFGGGESSPAVSNGHAENNDTMSWRAKNETPQKGSLAQCKYFQKGVCRYGASCKFQHGANGTKVPAPGSEITIDRSSISAQLPPPTNSNYIPLNKDDQRLDAAIQPPNQEEWALYNERFHRVKPCNEYHLKRVCMTPDCPYDHNELKPSIRHTLEYVVKGSPCPRKSECRVANCIFGHLCQKDGCTGQHKGCRMKPYWHNIDPKVVSLVPADVNMAAHSDDADLYGEDGEGYVGSEPDFGGTDANGGGW